MSNRPALEAINQHSCALACISYRLPDEERYNQANLIKNLTPLFPEWVASPGLLSRGRLIDLIQALSPTTKKILHTPDWAEAEAFHDKHQSTVVGFHCLLRQPTNHAYVVLGGGVASQTNEPMLQVMMPDQHAARIAWISIRELAVTHGADYLVFA